MNKIITPEKAITIAQSLHAGGKKIVLAGGCFDILHIGHITFLEQAKKLGDTLFIFVESDQTIRKQKGTDRPLNSQQDRATILAHLDLIDYVILLPAFTTNMSYDELVIQIKPAIIATTAGDRNRRHKERQARIVDGKVVDVIPQIQNQSTTRLLKLLHEKL